MFEPLRALLRTPSPALAECELTHIERVEIDLDRALAQHRAYAALLTRLGIEATILDPLPDYPDSCFVEDAGLAFPECFVLTFPGVASRRGEPALLRNHLPADRPILTIENPATIDGGDVLTVGKAVFVGLTSRTNRAGVDALAAALAPFGYSVTGVPGEAALHLKTAVTAPDDSTVLINPALIDRNVFAAFDQIECDPAEPFAGNCLRLGGTVVMQSAHPRTAALLAARGYAVETVDVSEFAKAEAGLTCLSLVIPPYSNSRK